MASVPHIYISALSWLPADIWAYRKLTSTPASPHHLSVTHNSKRRSAGLGAWCLGRQPEVGNSIICIACSPNGCQIVSGSENGILQRWDTSTGEPIGAEMRGHTGCVNSVAFTPDGQLIVSCSSDCTLRRWESLTGRAVGQAMRGHTKRVQSVA